MKRICKPLILGALVTLAGTNLAGCSGMRGDFLEPEVEVVDVQLDSISLLRTKMNFTVRIDNENPYPIAVDGAKHQFYLNGSYIGRGKEADKVEIPRLGSIDSEIEVDFSNLRTISQIRSIIDSGVVEYKILSTLYLDRTFGKRTVELTQEGEVPVSTSL